MRSNRLVTQWAAVAARLELVFVDSRQLFPHHQHTPCCPECRQLLQDNGIAQNAKVYKGVDKTVLAVTREWTCKSGAGSSHEQLQHASMCLADCLL